MVRNIPITLLVLSVGRLNLASRTRFHEDAAELGSLKGVTFDRAYMTSLLLGLSESEPLCGSRLFANISIFKSINNFPFTFKKGSGLLASSTFKDIAETFSIRKGPIPVLPGMSLLSINAGAKKFEGPWKSEKQAIHIINQQIAKQGSVDLTFDAGLDSRACWRDMRDTDGLGVCSAAVVVDLARALEQMPAKMPTPFSKTSSSTVTNYPRFIFKSFSEERNPLADFLRRIRHGYTKFDYQYGGAVYASGLAPMCFVVPGADGTDWSVMRKVELRGAKSIFLDGVRHLDLKGPKFAEMQERKSFFDNTLWSSTIGKRKDLAFTSMFPDGLTVSSCGGREVAFSMEKDAELLEALAMTDFSLMIKFYEADVTTQRCDNTQRAPAFPIILDVVKPFPFRIALGIVNYIEESRPWIPANVAKKPDLYHKSWMHMWPNYFSLSSMSLQEYRSELFAKRIRGFQVGKVVALMRLNWSGTLMGQTPFFKDVIHELATTIYDHDSACEVLPGELGVAEGEAEDGLLVRWDKQKSALFWVAPQNVMPVPR